MKKIVHAVVMDTARGLLSLLLRIVKDSAISPCSGRFLFVCCHNHTENRIIQSLMSISTLSSINGKERVPIRVWDLRLSKIRKSLLEVNTCTDINVFVIDNVNDLLNVFSVEEVEFIFGANSEDLLKQFLEQSWIVTPSIALTRKASELFSEYHVPFYFVEYWREKIYLEGEKDAVIHMTESIISVEMSMCTCIPSEINSILEEFFPMMDDTAKLDD